TPDSRLLAPDSCYWHPTVTRSYYINLHYESQDKNASVRGYKMSMLEGNRSASITASALSSNISPLGWRLAFSRAFPLVDSFSAHPDQGSPPRISRWNAGVPPLIYAIRLLTDHDSPFDLPASCGEARRPIRRSIPPGAGPLRYSGYRTCERSAHSCGACAASSTNGWPGGGRWPLSPPRSTGGSSNVDRCGATGDRGAPRSARLPPAANASW